MKDDEKLQALNQLLEHSRNSAFYRERLPGGHLTSLEHLKKLPFITKEDIRANSPKGLICVPKKELYQYHESFGTTGVPVSVWLTRDDFLDLIHSVNSGGINFSEDDIVLIRFPYAISGVAHFMHAAAQARGACVIPASSRSYVSPYTRIVNLLRKLNVTVLASLPLQAVMIAETAEMIGLKPGKDFPSLRAIYTAGEVLTPHKRKLLESIWGVPVSDNYGMTEIGAAAVDCEYGTLHPLEDKFIFELLDDDLKTEVETGQTGNLVITTLTRRGTPLIRYFTGDRAKIVIKQCPCGRKASLEVRGRMQDTVKVGNRTFDIWDLSEIVSRLPCKRFWAMAQMSDGLQFVVEQEKPEDVVTPEIVRMIEDEFNIKLRIKTVPKGELCDRNELMHVGTVSKPKYIYSQQEMEQTAYLKSVKV
jgi:phenylacetate-CoA ligase